jgi:hypothetical protein
MMGKLVSVAAKLKMGNLTSVAGEAGFGVRWDQRNVGLWGTWNSKDLGPWNLGRGEPGTRGTLGA